MKISELIKELQDEIEKYGDIQVYSKDYEWGDIDEGVYWTREFDDENTASLWFIK